MTKEQVAKIIKYWQKTADHDYKTMRWLFKGKRYSDALFFGHIVLEKILKGLVVQKIKKEAPYTHNLLLLMDRARAESVFSKEEIKFLGIVNEFNIRARYSDYKLQFHRKATLEYTSEQLKKIKKLYKKLCIILKKRK